MLRRTATVVSRSGLHARPASLFTKAAAGCGAPVFIARPDGAPVDAASVLSVMGLGIIDGEQVVLSTPDDAAGRVLDDLAALLATGLGAA